MFSLRCPVAGVGMQDHLVGGDAGLFSGRLMDFDDIGKEGHAAGDRRHGRIGLTAINRVSHPTTTAPFSPRLAPVIGAKIS